MSVAASIGDSWLRIVRARSSVLVAAVVAVNLGLTLFVEFRTLRNFPNSGDEYAYYVSAEIFARGKLSVPSPPHAPFFNFTHVVNDGRFYGKYPPGWPALLAVGVLLRVPWLINPVIGALTLLALHRLARRHFSPEAAAIALLMTAANPYFIFNSASYFSHSSCLLFTTLVLHFAFNCAAEPGDWKSFLGLGAAVGAAFIIRPFTTVIFCLPVLAYLTVRVVREKKVREALRGAAVAAAPLALFAILFLGYNREQTGRAFLQPFQMYDPTDAPSFPKDREDWSKRLDTHVINRLWQLNRWFPLSVVLLLVAMGTASVRRDPRLLTCAACLGGLFVAFFCYWGDGIVQYGPRYLYEAYSALLLVCASVAASFGRGGVLMVLGMLILGGATFVAESETVSRDICANREVHRVAAESGVTEGIIFVRRGWTTGPLWGSPGSVIDFEAPLLVVNHRGDVDVELLQAFPNRKGYYYDFDQDSRTGSLTPMGQPK